MNATHQEGEMIRKGRSTKRKFVDEVTAPKDTMMKCRKLAKPDDKLNFIVDDMIDLPLLDILPKMIDEIKSTEDSATVNYIEATPLLEASELIDQATIPKNNRINEIDALPAKAEPKVEELSKIIIENRREKLINDSDESDTDDFVDDGISQTLPVMNQIKPEHEILTIDSDKRYETDDSDDDDFVTVPDEAPSQRCPAAKKSGEKMQVNIGIGVIHKIIQCLKDAYMNGNGVYKIAYNEVIQKAKLEEFGNTSHLLEIIREKAHNRDSKVGVTADDRLFYKPKYNIRNPDKLLKTLSPPSGDIRSILFKDIEESLPNAKKVVEDLEKSGRVRCLRGRESKKVVFSTTPDFQPNDFCQIDESIRFYLRKADAQEKAVVMKQHAALFGLNRAKPNTVAVRRKKNKFVNFTTNQHLQKDLDIYNLNDISRLSGQPEEPCSKSQPVGDLVPMEGRRLIWQFASQVMSFEETLVLYSLSHSQGMTKDDLFEKLNLRRGDIDKVLSRLRELMLVRAKIENEKGGATFYHVNIKVFVVWVNCRLTSAYKRVMNDEKETQIAKYCCTGCSRGYSQYDVGSLLMTAFQCQQVGLMCLYCKSEVKEAEQTDTRALMLKFNKETIHLSELCRKCAEILNLNL